MKTADMEDIYFEAFLKQVIIENFHAEIDAIHSTNFEEEISLSSEFEQRMQKLFSKDRRKERIKATIKYTKRAAVIVAIIVTVLFGALLTSADVRAAVGKVVVEWFEKFTSFTFAPESSGSKENRLSPEDYISGYIVISKEIVGRATIVEMENYSGDNLSLRYTPSDGTANRSVDNENQTIEVTEVNGQEAFLVVANSQKDDNCIIWSFNGYRFTMWSQLPSDELKAIAEQIYK